MSPPPVCACENQELLKHAPVRRKSKACELRRFVAKVWPFRHHPSMLYGSGRVSTDGQSVNAQAAALRAARIKEVNIFPEEASRAKTDRALLRRAIDKGDLLIATRLGLDRLAHSTRDLLNTLAKIAEKGAGFRSLADAWADTTTDHGRLLVTFLGGIAEFERDLIRARTSEGRDRAMRGVYMGLPPSLTAHQREEALRDLAAGTARQADLARRFNLSRITISCLTQ